MTGSDGDSTRGERFERREFHSHTFHGGGERRPERKKSVDCSKGHHRFETACEWVVMGRIGPFQYSQQDYANYPLQNKT